MAVCSIFGQTQIVLTWDIHSCGSHGPSNMIYIDLPVKEMVIFHISTALLVYQRLSISLQKYQVLTVLQFCRRQICLVQCRRAPLVISFLHNEAREMVCFKKT